MPAHRDVVAGENHPRRATLSKDGTEQLDVVLHQGGARLQDDDVGVAIDHQPRQQIRLAVNETHPLLGPGPAARTDGHLETIGEKLRRRRGLIARPRAAQPQRHPRTR